MVKSSQSGKVRRLDRLSDRFEAAWRAGQAVRIEDYLSEVPEGDRATVLRELLVVEMQLRSERGEVWQRDEYRQRFPDDLQVVSAAFVLAEGDRTKNSGMGTSSLGERCRTGSPSSCLEYVSGTDRPDETNVEAPPFVPRLGRFELIERLGTGGFGTVWKAQDTVLKRWVALKIPRAGRLPDGDASLLLREARNAARLKHPAVVQVFDSGIEDGVAYIASEYVAGQSLRQHLREHRLSDRRAAEICCRIAGALAHAHEMGIVHRDLKPGNILLDEAGQAYVADFGVAKTEEWDAPAGQMVGTAGYMAPEQAAGRNDQVDSRADIYSLGVILYEMLTQRRLFTSGSPGPAAKMDGTEVPLGSLTKHAPRDLQAICLKCLRTSPGERYPTAAALAADLDRFLRGEPVAARPLWWPQRLIRWAKRRPAIAASTAFSLVLLAGMVIVAAFGYRKTARALEEAEAHLYLHRVIAADRAWRGNDMAQLHRLLEECPPALRGWEHGYLKNLPHGTGWVQHPAGGSVAFHPNAPQIATGGGSNHRLNLWDAETGERQASLLRHRSHILGIDYSRDGRWVATAGGRDRTAVLWRVDDRKEMRVYRGHTAAVVGVRFLPDNRRLVTVSRDGTLRCWDVESDDPLFCIELKAQRVSGLTVNADGTLVAVCLGLDGRSAKVGVWDMVTREMVWELPVSNSTAGLAFSPCGPHLAVATARDMLRVWDVTSGTVVQTYPCVPALGAFVAFDAGGQRIAVHCWDNSVTVFDTQTAQPVLTLRGHHGQICEIALSSCGETIAFGTSENRVYVHELSADQGMGVLRGHAGQVVDLAFIPRSSLLVSCGFDGTVRVWDAESRRELHVLTDEATLILGVDASPDGRTVAAGDEDGRIRIWDAVSGQLQSQWVADGDLVSGLAFHPDGQQLVSANPEGRLTFWDVRTGRALATLDAPCMRRRRLRITFSPCGSWLAVMTRGRSLRVFCTTELDQKWRFQHEADTRSVAFAHNGFLAVTTNDGGAHFWDLSTGSLAWQLPPTAKIEEADLVFHPDGSRFVICRGGQEITLWDYPHRQPLLTLREHADLAGFAVRFSGDGMYLATPRIDGSICVWRSPHRRN
jgi:eukaryotic-like serine/threonine-protein kinase